MDEKSLRIKIKLINIIFVFWMFGEECLSFKEV